MPNECGETKPNIYARILDMIMRYHALYQNAKLKSLTWTMPYVQHKTQYNDMYEAHVAGRRRKPFFGLITQSQRRLIHQLSPRQR
jgi:hypothetical protein